MNEAKEIAVSLSPLIDIEAAGKAWRELERRSPHSYFTAWGWIGSWLAHLPPGLRPQLLCAEYAGRIVGLAVLMARQVRQNRVFLSNGLFLNETGDPYYDQLTIEHNGILSEAGLSTAINRRCVEFLLREHRGWDEFFLRRIDTTMGYAELTRGKARYIEEMRTKSYYVDLGDLRAKGKDYLNTVSGNMRRKIRQVLRDYERDGESRMEVARDPNEALEYLQGLIAYHQPYWNKKGFPGSFANPFFAQFHQDLIRTRFAFGEIQLLRVSVADRAIGYVYNLVKDGHVYNYQTGFHYESNNKRRPGILSHYYAILHNLEQGALTYDFLAGEREYKRSLSTHASDMVWGRVQRARVKLQIRDTLKQVKRRLFPRPALAQ